jgi:hypothetical protein
MATERQVKANQINAQRSTGPRTAAGKTASSRNALRHGLTARQVVLAGEDAEAFDALRQRLQAEFSPRGPTQEFFVEQLASSMWRLRRVPALEAALLAWLSDREFEVDGDIDAMMMSSVISPGTSRSLTAPRNDASIREREEHEQLLLGRTLEVALKDGDLLSKLSRYEAQLLRLMERTLSALRALQAERPEQLADPDPANGPG